MMQEKNKEQEKGKKGGPSSLQDVQKGRGKGEKQKEETNASH